MGRRFFLHFDLPGFDTVAGYHDGVLTLTIPIAELAKPRRIDVGRCQDGDTALSGACRRTITGQAREGDQPAGAASAHELSLQDQAASGD